MPRSYNARKTRRLTMAAKMHTLCTALIPLVVFMGLTGCQTRPSASETDGKMRGGTVVIGSYTRPDVLNPLLTSSTVSAPIFTLLFSGLTQLTRDLTAAPDLAASWEMSPDSLTYTFHLRKDIRFHDGAPFTAEDVQFTYAQSRRPEYTPVFYILDMIERVDAIDPHTVRITLNRPESRFLTHATTFPIVPAHLLENQDMRQVLFNRQPVGTGPFKFEAWAADSTRLVLATNDAYHEGRPYLDRLVIWGGLNQTEMWVRLMREEIDVIPSLLPEDMEIVRVDSTTFRLYASLDPFYYTLSYNCDHPLFTDRRVRRAFSYALDRQAIVDRALLGHGALASGPFFPDAWASDPDVRPVPYDPREARRLLAEAGWTDRNGDGVLDKHGKPLEVELLVDTGDKAKETTALVVRQQLQEIGVKIRLTRLSASALIGNRLAPGDFEMALMQYNVGQDPATAALFWHSRNIGTRELNMARYRNARVDSLFDAGHTVSGFDRRQAIYREIHALIAGDQPAAFLYFKNRFEAVNRRIGGVEFGAESGRGYNLYHSAKKWHILPHS